MYFEHDDGDMESSKRRSLFVSLIVLLKYFKAKPFIMRNLIVVFVSVLLQ